ncbi:MAG: SixA phosphatase family protein [Angustibacter sp.]
MGSQHAGRTLLLVRHAKSDQSVSGPDHDRPLNARGRRDAPALGRWLSAHAPAIDLVLCSSAARARETWHLAARGLPADVPSEVRPSLYLAQPQAVVSQLRDLPDAVHVVAVVGHEPTQSALVEILATDAEPPAAQRFAGGFRTSAVARLHLAGAWPTLGPQTCRLADFAVPRA